MIGSDLSNKPLLFFHPLDFTETGILIDCYLDQVVLQDLILA